MGAAPKKAVASKMIQLARILVATDFSPVSNRALDYAVALARRYDSHLYLAHVISPDAYPLATPEVTVNLVDKQLRKAKARTQELLLSDRLHGVPYEVYIEEGPLWPTLDGIINKHEIDLVVVGTHGMGALEKLVIGSSAEQIFRQSTRPVLTVGPGVAGGAPPEPVFKHILFATEFGLSADREAAYAFSLGQEHEATVTLLHVVSDLEDYSESGTKSKTEAVKSQLRELVPSGGELWCQIQFRMGIGDPVDEILRIAMESEADLIVMGAKARAGLAGHLPRTKAYRVVSAAHCPVLTVRS